VPERLGQGVILHTTASRPALGPTQPPLSAEATNDRSLLRRMGLRINQEKNKIYDYKSECKAEENITAGSLHVWSNTDMYTYLGSTVICNNDISQEIKKRILIADKCFYGLKNQLK
jgi:hypothetical protein